MPKKKKIFNIELEPERWQQLKEIADRERRHVKHQAAIVLEAWIAEQSARAS